MNKLGIDEVGRGPIAGPVVVSGVLMISTCLDKLVDIKDSKKLSAKKRDIWDKLISGLEEEGKLKVCIAQVEADDVDTIGIKGALQKASDRVLQELADENTKILSDYGLPISKKYKNTEHIVKGDEKEPLIAAASIKAKVYRDKLMEGYGEKYPQYGFSKHKGYGTKAHRDAIQAHGPVEIHRMTFLTRILPQE